MLEKIENNSRAYIGGKRHFFTCVRKDNFGAARSFYLGYLFAYHTTNGISVKVPYRHVKDTYVYIL
jgi:hypothetical protein